MRIRSLTIVALLSALASPAKPAECQQPIIDAHGHIGASFKPAAIVEAMDNNGVSKQIVMARYYPGPAGGDDLPGDDELALKLAETYPGRLYPLVGMKRPLLTGACKWRTPEGEVEALIQFMLGMDTAHAPAMMSYSRRVQRLRRLLAQLSPETRAKFAERNAIRIFRLAG